MPTECRMIHFTFGEFMLKISCLLSTAFHRIAIHRIAIHRTHESNSLQRVEPFYVGLVAYHPKGYSVTCRFSDLSLRWVVASPNLSCKLECLSLPFAFNVRLMKQQQERFLSFCSWIVNDHFMCLNTMAELFLKLINYKKKIIFIILSQVLTT